MKLLPLIEDDNFEKRKYVFIEKLKQLKFNTIYYRKFNDNYVNTIKVEQVPLKIELDGNYIYIHFKQPSAEGQYCYEFNDFITVHPHLDRPIISIDFFHFYPNKVNIKSL